ncbi:hypothetical protein T265_10299 [Opisthorchis viverrini]|uniref:Uncharacterized protein n=1 Tax=Opisthorchis viverrini TaxID=6198 RepID=A0A074Z2Z5_OPIVI|nr:hypothetical protein T265_10299 [Opisthorchis viverrini]KER21368.1 hypothetical protein T265_10299 [Opisthorchis viverrini]
MQLDSDHAIVQARLSLFLASEIRAQSPGFRQPYVLLETKLHEISEYTLICKLIWFFRETHLEPS